MDKDYFKTVYQYNFWANRRVWNCVMQLTEAQFQQDLDYSIGSIYIQCLHTMFVEHWWFHFLREGDPQFFEVESFPDRASIRAQWDQEEVYILDYIDTLMPEALQRAVRPDFWEEGRPFIKVWEAMLQVANHSTDHRAQTLAGIHRLGGSTVGQDVLDYYFETRSPQN
jgi:uncharacterized damage-inducible protein DinB